MKTSTYPGKWLVLCALVLSTLGPGCGGGTGTSGSGSTDTGGPTDPGDTTAFFSEGPIVIGGAGSLVVNGAKRHALASDARVCLVEGTVTIAAAAKDWPSPPSAPPTRT